MSQDKNIFGVSDTDQSLQSKVGGVFGLNSRATIDSFTYEEVNEEGKEYKAVSITVKVGDKSYKNMIFLSPTVFDNNNNKLNPGDEGYDKAYFDTYSQHIAVIKSTLKALGVTDATITANLASLGNADLIVGMQKLVSLAPVNYQTIPVDVFLEYQWSIKEGSDRTFLTLPKNMKGGYFIHSHIVANGEWKPVQGENGLEYIDNNGLKHVFTRSKSYMESNKAKQQIVGEENSAPQANMSTPASATKPVWD